MGDTNVLVFGGDWFLDEAEAAKAYDRAALILFGEFSKLNFGESKLDLSNGFKSSEKIFRLPNQKKRKELAVNG